MELVIIESPYAGDVESNLTYLRACMKDCLVHRQESPYASHGLYTQPGVLDDTIPSERELGIQAGFLWRQLAKRSVFYMDRGFSTGMAFGQTDAAMKGRDIEFRAFLDGLDSPSYTIYFDKVGEVWGANAPRLPGGYVAAPTRDQCLEKLRGIAKERTP